MEDITIFLELNIKTKIQAQAIAGVVTTLFALACMDEEDAVTIQAILEDAPFLL